NVHGHNARLEVEVGLKEAYANTDYPDMVIDFGDLKKIVGPIVERLDHQMLNEVLKWSRPTAERLVEWIAFEVMANLPEQNYVKSVRLTETCDSWATWRHSG
ncbi:MAG: 6-pyruvoyl trahydropterin synthase family protein, partial [bacterium]